MKRVLFGAVAVASTFFAVAVAGSPANAESRLVVPTHGDSINEDASPTPLMARPRTDMVWMDLDPASVSPAVSTNKIYLNNCKPNGCVVRGGTGASSIDTSTSQGGWPISGTRTLTAFDQPDAVWNGVVDCMKDVFSPFGVEIITTNPSPAAHFEIMIAGRPQDLGMSSGIGGVSPFSCAEHIPNSLVFAFSKVYGNDVEEICATAAQEIAHSFRLDHVTDASDPLTYFGYNGRRRFKDANVTCGSDCVQGQGPQGETCSGSNGQTRICSCTNQPTQNSAARLRLLFGSGTPTPPMVKINNPKLGANVSPGFPVSIDASDDNGIQKVELYVDNVLTSTLMVGPFAFNAPSMLSDGTHNVKAIAYDIYGTSAADNVQVVIGVPCGKPADCAKDTDTCIGGRCVPGPGTQGGLGSTCNSGPDCASGQCASDSSGAKYCVENCVLDEGQCPEGFGCLEAGMQGVCWPGYDDGTGGICSAGGTGGALSLGLAFASMLFARRRRRS
ncbi:MAG: hypothetical protein JWP01_1572 [Myxococcales bacterium]|nr:hypothetical protein [Myxococcales bacterium]